MPGLRPHRFRRASGGRTASGRKIRQPCSQLGNSVIVPRSHDWTNAMPTVQKACHSTVTRSSAASHLCRETSNAQDDCRETSNAQDESNLGSIFARYGVPGPISMHCCCSDPAGCQSSEFGFYLWPMFRARAHIKPVLLLLRQKVLIQLLL